MAWCSCTSARGTSSTRTRSEPASGGAWRTMRLLAAITAGIAREYGVEPERVRAGRSGIPGGLGGAGFPDARSELLNMPPCNRTLLTGTSPVAAGAVSTRFWPSRLSERLPRPKPSPSSGRPGADAVGSGDLPDGDPVVPSTGSRSVACNGPQSSRAAQDYGIDATVVIGFKPAPLYSHAWVEVEGRVVGGSPAYQRKLCPLTRI